MGQSIYVPPSNGWKKVGTFTYEDFSVDDTTITIPVGYTIPFACVVTGVIIYVSAAFTAEGTFPVVLGSYTIDIIANSEALGVNADGLTIGFYSITKGTTTIASRDVLLSIQATCVGANLDQITSGSVDVFVNVSPPLEPPIPS